MAWDAMQAEGRLLEPEGVGLRQVLSVPFRNRLRVSQSVSVQFSSVPQLCPALCDPMNCSTPGFPVHQLLELAQTQVQ